MPTCLEGIVVLEVGNRVGVGLCGSLLAQLGAKVISVETTGPAGMRSVAPVVAGKLRLTIDRQKTDDLALLSDVAMRADVVLTSSDRPGEFESALTGKTGNAITCDIIAFGSDASGSKGALPDELIQASSGLLETTGNAGEPPIPIGVPIAEFLAAINAASGVLSALRLRRQNGGSGHAVEVALFDSGLESLSTFLARALAGKSPSRVGNRHPNIAPFNAYRTRDGLINLCTGSDLHWRRICEVIGRADVANSEKWATMSQRVAAVDVVDSFIEEWTIERTAEECIAAFLDAGIPAGPVTSVTSIADDTDLLERGVVRKLIDPATGLQVSVPGRVFGFSAADVRSPENISVPGGDRAAVDAWVRSRDSRKNAAMPARNKAAPLAGILVLEIGQYTTGPRASRNLAALGAEVIKVEMPPDGDPARTYAPFRDGQSYFFHLNNSGKQSIVLDLKSAEGGADLRKILTKCDILIENLKPGSLAKLGFGPREAAQINPRLVYCSVSGYGTRSIYRARPGMDSVIQGMAGLMDVTRSNGVPYKGGVSTADVVGGQFAVTSILAALEFRERTGMGQFVDVSMFDISTWLTQLAWNDEYRLTRAPVTMVQCDDGYAVVAANSAAVSKISEIDGQRCRMTRAELVELLDARDIRCSPVLSVAEAVAHPYTAKRGLIAYGKAPNGQLWEHVASPIRISGVPAVEIRAAGRLHDDQATLAARFGLTTRQLVRDADALVRT